MRTLAVLPVKSFDRAKQRLGDAVQRAELARAMVGDVLEALGRVEGLDGVIVVTAQPNVLPGARPGEADPLDAQLGPLRADAEVVRDREEAGQSPAALLGIEAALRRGAERALLVPSDCPALDPGEVDGLLADARADVVIVPDRHGSGTNALLLRPPGVMRPSFGPGSFARHAALARGAGASVRVARLPSLELDVDTSGDLEALLARRGGAPRTRALLGRAPAPAG
jgi:2-phospho-L-lactate guanylyltransferase